MRNTLLAVLAMAGLVLFSGCGEHGSGDENLLQINRTGFNAQFNPAEGVIPFPNNLLYSGSTDATVNIPVADETDFSDPQVALNALDGFSTIAPIITTFGGVIDPASLTPSSVRVFEVTLDTSLLPVAGPVSGVVGELAFGSDFLATVSSVDPDGATLVILPLKPLKPSSHYLVALTREIRRDDGLTAGADFVYVLAKSPNPLFGAGGVSQVPALSDAQAQALEPVRQLVNAQEAALASVGVNNESVILSWTFSTQSIGDVLSAARSISGGSSEGFESKGTTSTLGGEGLADVFQGLLNAPYYLEAAANVNDPTPLATFWKSSPNPLLDDTVFLTRFNPIPQANSLESIPLLVSMPNATSGKTKPASGWPVVIFQHPINADRTTLLPIADSLAGEGFAAVAIDNPLHGVASTDTLFYTEFERTFDLDLVNNANRAPGPDGIADPTGTHFINLASLLTTRDNGRQAVADLFALTDALAEMDADGGGPDFDVDNIYFVGHSLGGIVGSVFLALETSVKAATLVATGGGIAKLLDGSPRFGPEIAAGVLAGGGPAKGTADYESFLAAAQTVIDSFDPINYAADTVGGRGVLMLEVLGDTKVPNNVLADAPAGTVPSPTAGTDPLAALMGLTPVGSTATEVQFKALVRFTSGIHESLFDSSADPAVTTEMQSEMATFLATDRDAGAATVLVGNVGVVEQPSNIAAR